MNAAVAIPNVIEVRREGDVFVLVMSAGENRFDRSFVDAFHRARDCTPGLERCRRGWRT